MGSKAGKRSPIVIVRIVALLLASVGMLLPSMACATDAGIDSYEEYANRIKAAQEVAPLADAVFGDKVSLYTGSTSFEVTDFSIPGNSDLPVALSRELVIRDLRHQPLNGDGLLGLGDWNLDVPYIDGTFTQDYGWTLRASSQPSANRCSDNIDVPYTYVNSDTGPIYLYPERIWNGNELHIPGEGSQTLLVNNQSKSYAYANGAYTGSSVWKWVTTGNWKLRCVSSVAGMTGEGFTAVSPTGVSYTFNYAVTRPTSALANAYSDQYGSYAAQRVRIFLLATHVEDRFGNWVDYTYSGNHLTSISASDGRSVALNWSGDAITSVTSALGTWKYGYATASWTDNGGHVVTWPYLSSVTRPDGSKWTYTVNSGALVTNKNSYPDDTKLPPVYCQHDLEFMEDPNSGSFQYTVGAPSGAKAAYSFVFIREYRDMVPLGCSRSPDPNANYPIDATDFFDTFSLASKQVSGPGLTTALYVYSGYSISLAPAYSYPEATSPNPNSGNPEPYEPPISCSACPLSKIVTVKGPTSVTKYTYGIQYAHNEGQLLQTQITDLSNNVLRTTTYTYISDTQAPSQLFPDIAGYDLLPNYISPMANRNRPVAKIVIKQDDETFTTNVSGFDVLARAIAISESSSLGYSRVDETAYHDDADLWVLGQVAKRTIAGVVAAETSFDTKDQPLTEKRFGKLMSTKGWNTDGTLQSVTDGRSADGKSYPTTFSGWKRGLPQTLRFYDGTQESAVVSDAGWITSITTTPATGEGGFTTGYDYDPMGRLASITYPSDVGVTWNKTSLSFTPESGSEYGIPGGHWKQTVHTGNGYTVTYFDALWRPLVTEHFDNSSSSIKAATLSQTVQRYDGGGRTIFTSYPVSNLSNYATLNAGTHTSYDALDRVTIVDQDWELSQQVGPLRTKTEYQTGFKTKITDPRDHSTTISYQAFGEPDTSRPVSISMPEGATTTIFRDSFGKPLWVKRSGTYGGTAVSATRTFVYDSNQLLCKRIDPETSATLFAYDGANNLVWSAPGTSLTSSTCDRTSVSANQKITREYYSRNWLKSIVYPDGLSNTEYTYAFDGSMLTAINHNGSSTVETVYGYDSRRLLTAEALTVPGASTFPVGYGYDANGHLSSLNYPDGLMLTFMPNALGQPTQASGYATGVSYFPNGAIKQFTYGDGSVHTLTQNLRGLPERSRDSKGATAVLDNTADYDEDGNVQAITDGLSDNVGNIDMSYDGLNRLTLATSPMFAGNHQASFTYDPLDNLRSAGVGNGNQYTYTYDLTKNLLTAMVGSQTVHFGYDARGNVISEAQAYTFDMANRLLAANGLESYLYDAGGRRARKSNLLNGALTYYDYDKTGLLLYEWDPATMLSNDYVYLAGSLVAKITKDQTPPPPPPPPPATPASINVPASSYSASIPVNWSTSTGATSYVLQQSFNAGAWGQVYSGSASSKTVTVSATGSYTYRVKACGEGGCSGYRTSGAVAVTLKPTSAPSLTASTTSSSSGSFTLNWSAVTGATRYQLNQSFNGGADSEVYNSTGRSWSSNALGNGSYAYHAYACNAAGCSARSNGVTVTVLHIPAAPTSVTAPLSAWINVPFTVSWSPVSGASRYDLHQTNLGSGAVTTPYSNSATSTVLTLSGPADTMFRYSARACNSAGCSGWTDVVHTTYLNYKSNPLAVPASGSSGP